MELLKKLALVGMVAIALVVTGGQAAAEPGDEFDDEHAQCMEEDHTEGPARAIANVLPDQASDGIKSLYCMDATASDNPGAAVERAAKEAWPDGPFADFVRQIKDGNPEVISFTMTMWTDYKVDADSFQVRADGINNVVWQASLIGLALSIILGGFKVLSSRNEGSSESLSNASKGYGRYFLFGVVVPIMAIPAIGAFDALADSWITKYVTGGDVESVADMAKIGEEQHPLVILLLVGLSALGSAAMCLAMIVRTIVLPVLIGLMPIFAAWSIGNTGKSTLSNAFGATLAFILLKPVAAGVYMSAMWAATGVDGGEPGKLVSVVILGVVGLAAPGIFAIIMPLVSGQAGGGGAAVGSAMMGATGATMALGAGGAGLAMAGGSAAGSALGGSGSSAAGSSAGSQGAATGAVTTQNSSPGASAAQGGAGNTPGTTGAAGSPSTAGNPPQGGSSTGGAGSPAMAGNPAQGGPSTGGAGAGGTQPATATTGAGAGQQGPSTGANPSGGGNGMGATAARIFANAGGQAAQTLNNTQGMLDAAVGAPAHPER